MSRIRHAPVLSLLSLATLILWTACGKKSSPTAPPVPPAAPYHIVAMWGTVGNVGTYAARFRSPSGVALDATGNVYVTSNATYAYEYYVYKFTRTGAFLTAWGDSGAGNGQFRVPTGAAVDASGNVYVGDVSAAQSRSRVQKFTSSGAYLAQWGTFGTGNGQFRMPGGVGVDAGGNVYVADTDNHRVQKFTSSGAFITAWGDSGNGNGQFLSPWGVGVDAGGNLYVVDAAKNRIQKFTAAGAYLAQWGTHGTGNGQFDQPRGVAVDGGGNVYVADWLNHRIQKFSGAGAFVTAWGDSGSGWGQLMLPSAVAVDDSGNVYIADTATGLISKYAPGP